MAAITQTHGQSQLKSHTRQSKKKSYPKRRPIIISVLKAALFGSAGYTSLILIGLIPLPATFYFITLSLVVIPGYLLVCLSTGLLAATFSGDSIDCTRTGAEVAWIAGFWAGVGGAVVAMFLAANGLLMVNIGQSVLTQLPPGPIESLNEYARPTTVALVGRVFGVLLIYGIIGSLISALISALGGMLCVKLT